MRLLLANDPQAASELLTTRESKTPSGATVYHPGKRDDDHITDSFRAAVLAMRALVRETGASAGSYGGWASPSGHGSERLDPVRPPWFS